MPGDRFDVWALVRQAQDGDAEAFGRLYDHYVTLVYRYVLHRVGDRAQAEDFTSETFVRALRRIDSLSFQGRDVGAWLVTIARTIIRDHVKSSRFRLEVTTADMRDADQATDGPEDAVVARLRALATDLDDDPSPDFRAATRARLVAMAAVRSPEPEPRRGPARQGSARPARRPAWRTRLAAGVAGAAMAVTALGTLVALSTDAEPGDTLYGLKRGTEQTQLALAGDERGLTLLEFATTRLQELDRLVDGSAGTPPVDLVLDTLATMDAQTSEGAALVLSQAVAGGDAGPLSVVSGWAQDQGDGLAGLQAALPADAVDAAIRSLGLVGDVGTRAAELRVALDCPTGTAVAGTDDLGPVPAPCAAPATPDHSAPVDPSAGTADPGTPVTDAPAAPSSSPAPSSPTPSGAPAAPSTGSGGGSAGSTGSGGGTAPSGGGSTPTTSPPAPGGGLPLPVPSLPVPGGGGQPSVPSTAPTATPPPILDLPLPVCIPPILC
ncbi:sigma-70 family RNA polymerase sigma factor [Geodermatophilus normandii]|uniref:sigma-70 family RNA polymerase sigma factor n=1 Tax=Geodermatophilus normandii TaxID=1137989 RepID=UPI0031F3344B